MKTLALILRSFRLVIRVDVSDAQGTKRVGISVNLRI